MISLIEIPCIPTIWYQPFLLPINGALSTNKNKIQFLDIFTENSSFSFNVSTMHMFNAFWMSYSSSNLVFSVIIINIIFSQVFSAS